MGVVPALRGDDDERESAHDRVLDVLEVVRVVRVVGRGDPRAEVVVGGADLVAAARVGCRACDREIGVPVGERRQKLGRGVPVVDVREVLRLHTLGARRLARGTEVVTQRGEEQREGREPLLPVDDEQLGDADELEVGALREDEGPDEVREARIRAARCSEIHDVGPQLRTLCVAPRVRPLVERDLVLLPALEHPGQVRLCCLDH